MATIIEVNSGMALGNVFSPPQNPNIHRFVSSYYDNLTTMFGNIAGNAIQAARNTFDAAVEFGIKSKALLTNMLNKSSFHPDTIVRLETLSELRLAEPVMQRYIMSDSFIRQHYHDQLCSGYVDTYVDHFNDLRGKQHYDYRLANDGLLYESEEVDGGYVSDHFHIECLEGDRKLTPIEQFNIKLTTMAARAFLEDGVDPTDAAA